MKRQFVFILFVAVFLVACSNNQNNENSHQDETHVHEDGSTHQNHDDNDTAKQEEFDVTQDTTLNQADSLHHTHDGSEHTHQH
ncbi:MAG: hypothetical protein IPO63_03650 [Bacteroidetes bacterium]|nr:hypothetical protein [Bacteroidota bacterium]